VRVDNSNATAFADIINSHIGDKGGFTSAGFTNDIGMAAAVFALFDTKNSVFVSELGFGKKGDVGFFFWSGAVGDGKIFGRVGIKFFAPGNVGEFGNFVGKVPNGGKFFSIKYLPFEIRENFSVDNGTE